MPRPKKKRLVHRPPLYTSFKPIGVRVNVLEQISLTLDELEAIRLTDFDGKDHAEAADEMEISRSTFTRLIEKARRKVAQFLIEGKHLFIEGGDVHFKGNILRCQHCGHMFKTDFENPMIVCPSCGSKDLMDLAGGFGHGKCCRGFNRGHGR
ncbi:MAG: DUF134 domain-containing protein [Candidatus Cloacimonetes bacterium]|nr:DUF134 domain-containing protein [Candidatus Cloacimonadota bacterium]MCF7813882.1 DUF134 domain-containing protein [Candidatus Cloacimonadota bacterium]MCF7868907.1 DUF134 domain-containing protein [Candidatus Cloacimonadota bacterium]MCF7883994.1 DUF134 domain-containing protein [Candidatus Cloacimonadota bacterium]